MIDVGFDEVGKGLDDPKALVPHFAAAARRAIAQGAEALIPGQLYLSEAIARAGLTRIDEVPVVDGLSATLKMAEAMFDLKRLGILHGQVSPGAEQVGLHAAAAQPLSP